MLPRYAYYAPMTVQALGIIPTWTFGDRLRKARLTLDMSQRDFADLIDVNHARYSQWEADNNMPRGLVSICERIQEVTGVSAAWLLGLQVSPTPDFPGSGLELPHLDSNQEPCDIRRGDFGIRLTPLRAA